MGQLLPHPVYARQYRVSILNPSHSTFKDPVLPLLTEAHDKPAARRAGLIADETATFMICVQSSRACLSLPLEKVEGDGCEKW